MTLFAQRLLSRLSPTPLQAGRQRDRELLRPTRLGARGHHVRWATTRSRDGDAELHGAGHRDLAAAGPSVALRAEQFVHVSVRMISKRFPGICGA